MAESSQTTHEVQHGVRVVLLSFYGQPAVLRIHGKVEIVGCAGREACRLIVLPLHGGTGACPVVAAFFAWQVHLVLHGDFVTIIDEGHTGHREEEGHGYFQLVERVTLSHMRTLIVVVGCRDGDVAFVLGGGIGFRVVVDELADASPSRTVEITIVVITALSPRRVPGKEERGIALDAEVNHEVDVESGGNGDGRVGPLGDEHALRIVLILPLTHLVPE